MKWKTWLLPVLTAILFLAILKIPVRSFFHSFPDYQQDLLVSGTKGLMVVLFALSVLWRFRLWKNACFPINQAKNLYTLLPAVVVVLLFMLLSGKSFRIYQGSAVFLLGIIGVTIIRTASEELICRGVMQSWFMGQGRSPRTSILLSSFIFAFMHIANGLVHGDWVSVINQIIFAFFLGLIFGSVALMTGNILFSCLLHALINLPAALKKYNPIEMASDIEETVEISAGESILQVLLFIVLFSPLIAVAIYYINHRRWMPEQPPAAENQV